MPARLKKQLIACAFFSWKLGTRNGVYFADGRTGNQFDLKRQSLGTRVLTDAIENLKQLDLKLAVEKGLIKPAELANRSAPKLALQDGWALYRTYVARPRIAGGAKQSTVTRYTPVLNKFIPFAEKNGVKTWNDVTKEVLFAYAALLDESHAYRSKYLELTTLKQVIKYLRQSGHLPDSLPRIDFRLSKVTVTDSYCYSREEVLAMVRLCRENNNLAWIGEIIIGLASTGLRIGELASLRWSDINLEEGYVTICDESTRAPRKVKGDRRETKSSRSRSFPICPELRQFLVSKERSADGILFHGRHGGKLRGDTIRRVFNPMVKAPLTKRFPTHDGKLGFQHGTLHSFRHYFTSVCATTGIPELVVMKWLGHRNSEMVRYYYTLHDKDAQRLMEKVRFIEDTDGTVP